MKQVIKLALLMTTTLSLSTSSFASNLLNLDTDDKTASSKQVGSLSYKPDLSQYSGLKPSSPNDLALLDQLQDPNHFLKSPKPTMAVNNVDYRSFYNIFDQGELGSCTANALIGNMFAMQVMKHIQENPDVTADQAVQFVKTLSRMYLYYQERKREGTTDEDSGASLADGIITLINKGAPLESLWPYDLSQFAVQPPKKIDTPALKNRDLDNFSHARIPAGTTNTLNLVKQALVNKSLASIGIVVFDSFESDEVAASGIMPMPDMDNENIVGGHALTVVGYDDVKRVFLVANSYGTSWGQNGFFEMPYEYFTTKTPDGQNLVSEIFTLSRVSDFTDTSLHPNAGTVTHLGNLSDRLQAISTQIHAGVGASLSAGAVTNHVKKQVHDITSELKGIKTKINVSVGLKGANRAPSAKTVTKSMAASKLEDLISVLSQIGSPTDIINDATQAASSIAAVAGELSKLKSDLGTILNNNKTTTPVISVPTASTQQ